MKSILRLTSAFRVRYEDDENPDKEVLMKPSSRRPIARAVRLRRSEGRLSAAAVLLAACSLVLLDGTAFEVVAKPAAVKCRLRMRYEILRESPSVDLAKKFKCEGTVKAVSDVDATDLATRQVIFHLDDCPRLPATVVFGNQDVTEVRAWRGDRTRAHVFAGECRDCVVAPNTDVTAPQLDSAHFDATFALRPLDSLPDPDILLPAGKGLLTIRSERTDRKIVRAAWSARKCEIIPRPPIFCGGFAGVACPDPLVCVDYPDDACDPAGGDADCVGICVNGGS